MYTRKHKSKRVYLFTDFDALKPNFYAADLVLVNYLSDLK